MTDRLRRVWDGSFSLAWALIILTLPLTSLPILARWSGANTVAAPAAMPLLWLVLGWFLPYLLRRGRIPRLTLPFTGFVLVALIATAAAHFRYVPPLRGRTIAGESLDAVLTLAVGSAFYLVAATWPRDRARLTGTLRLLNWSGGALLVWSLIQAYFILFQNGRFPRPYVTVQDWLSLRDLFVTRVTGLAYEPSWLAHQLNILYLPFWAAASVRGTSVHRRRVLGISVENALLVAGILVLILTFSRVGILAALLGASYLFIRANRALLRKAHAVIIRHLPARFRFVRALSVGIAGGIGVLALAAYGLGALALVYAFSRYDPRLAALFDPTLLDSGDFFWITNRLAFAERAVYWAAGWQVFNDYPLIGVGLGVVGFHFPESVPAFGWALWESLEIIYRLDFIANTKSMWVRLLAETGVVGFALFLTWIYTSWRAARTLERGPGPLIPTISLAGQLVVVAYLIEGFSLDSFALPYLWVSLGLLAACATWTTQPPPEDVEAVPPAA